MNVLTVLLSASSSVGVGYFRDSSISLENGLHRVIGRRPRPAGARGARSPAAAGRRSAQNLLIIGDDDRSGLTSAQKKQLHVGASSATASTDTLLVVHVPADGARPR